MLRWPMARSERSGSGWRARVGLPALLCAAVAGLWAFTPAPAAASGTVLSTQAATAVNAVQATLHGTASGYSGTGDYCTFVVGLIDSGGASSGTLVSQYPASPCDGSSVSYQQTVGGFGPGTTHWFAAVHCVDPVLSGGSYYCLYPSSGPYTSTGWDTADTTCISHPSFADCQTFTTPSLGATTAAAGSITGEGATLNGTLNLEGDACDVVAYKFEYSTDPNLTAASTTTATGAPCSSSAQTAPLNVSAAVSNLPSGTTIYYRLDAISLEGSNEVTLGSIESFRTGGYVTDNAATSITSSSVQLNAEVAAGDNGYSYSWLYSKSDATSAAGALDSAATTITGGSVASDADQLVNTALSGLQADTTYYFQVAAYDPTTGAHLYGLPTAFTTLPFGCSSGQVAFTNQPLGATGFDVNGCVSGSGPWTIHGTAVINGLTFDGTSSAQVTIDPSAGTLTVSTGYTIDLGTVQLYNTNSAALGPVSFTTSGGVSTFDLPQVTSNAKLFSLTIGGTTSVAAQQAGGATVTISALGMPILFSGITAQATVAVNQDGSLGSVTAQLGNSAIGPLTLPGVTLSYDATENQWSGTLNMQIPYVNDAGLQQSGIEVNLVIQNGELNGIGGAASWPDGIPLGDTGIEISSIGFNTVFNPLTLEGSLGGSLGPQIDNIPLFGFSTGFYMGFNQNQTLNGLPGIPNGTVLQDVPFTLGLNGELNLLGVYNLVSSSVAFYAVPRNPLIAISTQMGQPIQTSCGSFGGNLGIDAGIDITGDAALSGFNLLGDGHITLHLCDVFNSGISVNTIISSVGGAFCASVAGNSVGVGFDWPQSLSSFADVTKNLQLYLTGGCDVGNYVANLSLAARGGARDRVVLPGGLPFAVIRVRGRGGAPFVSVRGPHGLRIHTDAQRGALSHRYIVIPDAGAHTTYVEIRRPGAGAYTVLPEAGSVPITQVAAAHGERPPVVHGRLRRVRHGRVLVSWRARPLPHQTLVFEELGAGGGRRLWRSARARGSFSYRPQPGLRGVRAVDVMVYEFGQLNRVIRLGRFRGPVISRPGKPQRLQLRRRGARLIVRWRAARPGATQYRVTVISQGSHRMLISRREVLVVRRDIPRRGRVLVSVVAVNSIGQLGPRARAQLR